MSRLPKIDSTRPPTLPAGPAARRRVRKATRLWGYFTLAGISVLSALVIWHLARRGRLIRARLGPPRSIRPPLAAGGEPEPGQTGSAAS